MDFLDEYSLLIVVSIPVLVIVAMQVALYISGERGTLLLCSYEPFEPIDFPKLAIPALEDRWEEERAAGMERRMAPPVALPPSLERRRAVAREREAEFA